MAELPGLNYATPLTIEDLQHLEATYTEEFVARTLATLGGYRAGGARHGILDEYDPTAAGTRLVVTQNPNDAMTVDVAPGSAVTPGGMLVRLNGDVEAVEMAGQQLGQQNVIYLEYRVVGDPETIRVTRYNTTEPRQFNRPVDFDADPLVPQTLGVVTLGDFHNPTLFPPERLANIVALALVSVTSTEVVGVTEVSVDLSRQSLPENRPWFSPVDQEHRSQLGTGSPEVPHSLGLNDLSQGDVTLYDQLLRYGMVLGRDRDVPGVPGGMCIETITPTRIKTDTDGSVTGILSQRYVRLTRFPVRLLGAPGVAEPDNEFLVGLIPGTNLLTISHTDIIPTGGFRLYYSAVDAGEPLANSLINDEVHFRQPSGTEELLVSDGRAFSGLTPGFTDAFGNNRARIEIGTAGAVPRKHRVYADQNGALFFAPQHILCSTRLDDLGVAAYNFQVALRGSARVKVALHDVDLTAPTVVRLRLGGFDNDGAAVTEDLTFDFAGFDNPVVGQCQENPRNFQTTGTVFSSLTSVTILERTADGPDTAVCVYGELTPHQTPGLGSALPLAEVMWDGATICRVQDIRPVAATVRTPSDTTVVQAAGHAALTGMVAAGFSAVEVIAEDLRDPWFLRATEPLRLYKQNDGLRSAGLPETVGVELLGDGTEQDQYVSRALRLVVGPANRYLHVGLIGRDTQVYRVNGADGVTPSLEYRTCQTTDPTTWSGWTESTALQGLGQGNGVNHRIALDDTDYKVQLRVKGSVVGVMGWQLGTGVSGGVVLPRLTTAERNAVNTPPPGSMIFNTDTNTLQYYNGTSWLGV